ncbi:MAG TPA: Rieske 2Fe-2S domain-containing protein, partial [Candidatus Baltobacteraceae bacterium]
MVLQGFVKAIQDQTVLDQIADPAQPALKRVFRRTSDPERILKNALSGTWLGHPLHPIMKDVPIGAWTMAAIFDTLAGADAGMQRAADVSIVTGIAGALASAITGLADWSDTQGRARRIGVAHAALNVTALALYASSLAARLTGRRSRGIALAYCGYGVMGLGAYLGGHLVFGEQIGVNHATQNALPTDFIDALPDRELLENQPRRVDYHGVPVVLVRQASRIHALYERCSHMAGPLAEGRIEDGSIRCPWHGSRFALEDGR